MHLHSGSKTLDHLRAGLRAWCPLRCKACWDEDSRSKSTCSTGKADPKGPSDQEFLWSSKVCCKCPASFLEAPPVDDPVVLLREAIQIAGSHVTLLQ